jgi:hypothetical protein
MLAAFQMIFHYNTMETFWRAHLNLQEQEETEIFALREFYLLEVLIFSTTSRKLRFVFKLLADQRMRTNMEKCDE